MVRDPDDPVVVLIRRLRTEFADTADQIIMVMAETIGDCRITFPGIKSLWRQERDRRICNEFKGDNIDELALRYHLSTKHVRRILAAE